MVVTMRRRAELGEGQRQPVEVVVHQVELARPVERVGDVQRLPDPAVQLRVLGVRHCGHTPSSVAAVTESRGGEQGDVDAEARPGPR